MTRKYSFLAAMATSESKAKEANAWNALDQRCSSVSTPAASSRVAYAGPLSAKVSNSHEQMSKGSGTNQPVCSLSA